MRRVVLEFFGISFAASLAIFVAVSALTSLDVTNLFAQDKIGADKPPIAATEQIKALNNAYVTVCDAVLPTVVSINIVIEEKQSNNPFMDEFRRFFGDTPNYQNQPSEGSGSGVIISDDGYIVTNNHVVESAKEIKVKTYDKKEYKAKLVGTDPLTDLALIKIEASGLPKAHLANIDDIKVGQIVFAVGNPLGLNSTVTNGIVSAIGRGELSLNRDKDGFSVENFIQTDAAINPGNSGGGLFNIEGSLVGINTAIATRTGTYIGYGFAIPVDIVRSVVYDLMDDGKINRGYIGVQIRSLDETTAKTLGLNSVDGVLVHDVIKGSPADKAGIEPGDVIMELNGKKVKTSNELQGQIVTHRAGDNVELSIWRENKMLTKSVKLEPKDGSDYASSEGIKGGNDDDERDDATVNFDKLGFAVEQLSKQIKESYNVDNGVLITRVGSASVAAKRGLAPNGIIIKADRKEVNSPKDLRKIINSKKSGDAVLLQIKYKDSNRFVAIEIP